MYVQKLKDTLAPTTIQYIAMVTGSLGIVSSGMQYGWPSPSLPQLLDKNSTIPTTNSEGSWLAVIPLMGSTLGGIIGCLLVDIIGRKKVILLTALPFFIGWIMVAFAKSVTMLLIARFISGIGDGFIFTSLPMYLGEIANPKIRGLLGSSCSITWIFGFLLINGIGSYFAITTTAIISSVFPVLLFVTFLGMPESFYYLIMKGKMEKAQRSLKIFKGTDDVDMEFNRISAAIKEQTENTGKFLDLFTVPSNRRGAIIMLGLRSFQQLSGATTISFYLEIIFNEVGANISSGLIAVIYFGIELIVCCISSALVDRAGRRPLLMISSCGSALTLFIEGAYFYVKNSTDIDTSNFTFIPFATLILFIIIFSIGMQNIPIIMAGELFPANVKGFALCLVDIYYSIIATIGTKMFQILKDSSGMHVPFFLFGVFDILGLIFIAWYVPETKGKTLEGIQEMLQSKSRSKESKIEETMTKL